jgi:hypothetical protein
LRACHPDPIPARLASRVKRIRRRSTRDTVPRRTFTHQGRRETIRAVASAPSPPRAPAPVRAAVVAATFAAGALTLFFFARPPPPEGFDLQIYAASGATALGPRCAPGDRVAARYRTTRRYALLLERDGDGFVQVVHPWGGTAAERRPRGRIAATTSWVLDATPGSTCFAALFSDAPLDVHDAMDAFARTSTSPLLPRATHIQCCDKQARR